MGVEGQIPSTEYRRPIMLRHRLFALMLPFLLVTMACAGDPPEVPRGPDGTVDLVLDQGRKIWSQSCMSCHGSDGSGGRGSPLVSVEERFPSISDQIIVVSEGRNAMPGFGGRYSDEELRAVVRYTREVL